MMRFRNKSSPLLLIALVLILSIRCSTQVLAGEAFQEYSRHVEWPKNLPPPDTEVYLDTPVGRFRLPIGYIADPTIFTSEKTLMDPDGHRIFRFGKLPFKFVMPTGAMSDNKVRWLDVVDAEGHMDLTKYVVWFLGVERGIAGRDVPIDWPQGVLVEGPGGALPPNVGHSYRGRIDLPATGDQAEAELYDCDRDVCASHFYFKREGLSFWVLLPIERHNDAFLIAAKASELLAQWTVQR